MSIYNMINGVNQAAFYVLPMLGKHPDEYPRFRDCWIGEVKNSSELDQFGIPQKENDISKKIISVYTRVGGGNREDYQDEIDALRATPGYIKDFDDSFDSTFAMFEFEVPPEWMADFDLILDGKLPYVSKEYQQRMYDIYPKLKESFDKIFLIGA